MRSDSTTTTGDRPCFWYAYIWFSSSLQFLYRHRRTWKEEKPEETWLSPMAIAPTPTEKSKKRDNMKNATKKTYYTTIPDRLRTANWSNSSHPTDVVKSMTFMPPVNFIFLVNDIICLLCPLSFCFRYEAVKQHMVRLFWNVFVAEHVLYTYDVYMYSPFMSYTVQDKVFSSFLFYYWTRKEKYAVIWCNFIIRNFTQT